MECQRALEHLSEVEAAAEDVLADKQQIVDLDARRNRNREALSALRTGDVTSHTGTTAVAFCTGDVTSHTGTTAVAFCTGDVTSHTGTTAVAFCTGDLTSHTGTTAVLVNLTLGEVSVVVNLCLLPSSCQCFPVCLFPDKVKVCFGNMFIKFSSERTKVMIQKDQEQLDREINDLRKRLKAKVNRLNDLQGKPELQGYNLSPLSNEELNAIHSILKR
uniref:P53 and DNA damage-regulated protein 1 n=1 Tax=Electrophorus electricus TaxID=8005 RepID=A0AAY5F1S5_ELEEL